MTIQSYTALPQGAVDIRKAVFMQEQGFCNEFDELDDVAIHLLMTDGDVPVGTCRLYPGENADSFILGRIAIMKSYRGQGLGAAMVAEAERIAAGQGRRFVQLHAQVRASAFYEKAGYVPFGDEDDDEGVPHIWMQKEVVK